MSQPIVIIGGGVVGLTAAVVMRRFKYDVIVVDSSDLRVDKATRSARVYAINQASAEFFEQLGVWSLLVSERFSPYQKMHVWDAQNGAAFDFDARMQGSNDLGHILDEANLKQALLTRARALGVTLLTNHKIDAFEEVAGGVNVNVGNQTFFTPLLMVADGARSTTRAKLGAELVTWSYEQHAIVATVKTELAHKMTAYQVFRPQGPLAFLPLADSHMSSIVWSTTPTEAEILMQLDDAAFSTRLKQAFSAKLGACRVQDRRVQFPLTMRHTKQYVGAHWLLLGDAAHTIHPLAGQGLNLGLADVKAWSEVMAASQGQWRPRDLKAFQRQRKHAVWQMIALMEGLKATFAASSPVPIALRGLGLRTLNRVDPFKRLCLAVAQS